LNARVAVVTPYYKEPLAMLRQCHESVLAQEADFDHFMVADGHALPEIDEWDVKHVRLPVAHGDNGNTPRSVGSVLAETEGYDFIAYLDADNWFHSAHLATLLATYEGTRAPVCCSKRSFHALDGRLLKVAEGDEESGDHVDTSCLLLHRDAFGACSVWHRMPRQLAPICDRIFFKALLNARLSVARTGTRTLAFRSQYLLHYTTAGETPPPGCKGAQTSNPPMEYLFSFEGIRDCVANLGFWPGASMEGELLASRNQDPSLARK
jgi:glycosyltransferase involved in cell wall biosynthesis